MTPAVSEERARQGMACFLAIGVVGHRCQKYYSCVNYVLNVSPLLTLRFEDRLSKLIFRLLHIHCQMSKNPMVR